MGVTHEDIAKKVGLSRTTVTKILNRDPSYVTSEKTRNDVFKAAEELGYNFMQIRRPFRREQTRVEVGSEVHISIIFKDGKVFDTGTAMLKNVSTSGALLTSIVTSKNVLPLRSFSIILRVKDCKELQDLVGECTMVRLSEEDEDESETPEIGVRFLNISPRDKKRIDDFVDKYGEKEKTAPLLKKHK